MVSSKVSQLSSRDSSDLVKACLCLLIHSALIYHDELQYLLCVLLACTKEGCWIRLRKVHIKVIVTFYFVQLWLRNPLCRLRLLADTYAQLLASRSPSFAWLEKCGDVA